MLTIKHIFNRPTTTIRTVGMYDFIVANPQTDWILNALGVWLHRLIMKTLLSNDPIVTIYFSIPRRSTPFILRFEMCFVLDGADCGWWAHCILSMVYEKESVLFRLIFHSKDLISFVQALNPQYHWQLHLNFFRPHIQNTYELSMDSQGVRVFSLTICCTLFVYVNAQSGDTMWWCSFSLYFDFYLNDLYLCTKC